MVEAIDYHSMYKETKKVLTLQFKQIKELMLYNLINDTRPYVIIDNRYSNKENKINTEEGNLRNDVLSLTELKDRMTKIKEIKEIKEDKDKAMDELSLKQLNTRLIVIIANNDSINEIINTDINLINNEKSDYIYLIDFIRLNETKVSSLFYIKEDDFEEFRSFYPFYFIHKETKEVDCLLAKTHFPCCLIDGILFCGSFMQARNLKQLKALGIKSIIGLTEQDQSLIKEFKDGEITYFPVKEDLKGEIEFSEIIKQFNLEMDENCYPVLVYCFSGKTLSVAVCIAILMKYKKLNLMAATAVVMKVMPDYKLPTWLYSQLQRWKY